VSSLIDVIGWVNWLDIGWMAVLLSSLVSIFPFFWVAVGWMAILHFLLSAAACACTCAARPQQYSLCCAERAALFIFFFVSLL